MEEIDFRQLHFHDRYGNVLRFHLIDKFEIISIQND